MKYADEKLKVMQRMRKPGIRTGYQRLMHSKISNDIDSGKKNVHTKGQPLVSKKVKGSMQTYETPKAIIECWVSVKELLRQKYREHLEGKSCNFRSIENRISLTTHFCSLAMKHHPDRKTDPKDKEIAKQKFQEISQAYNILRDRKYNKMAKSNASFKLLIQRLYSQKASIV